MKIITLRFEDKVFKKLENAKEESKILGNCHNWESFILLLAKLKGGKN